MITPLLTPLLTSMISGIIRPALRRWIYNFDGNDDRGQLFDRLINPDGDNSYEFWTPPVTTGSAQTLISQNITGTTSAREFDLFMTSLGNLAVIRGGTQTTIFQPAQGLKLATKYGLRQTGDFIEIFEGGLNGPRVRTVTAPTGAAREPTAPTNISCRGAGTGSYGSFAQGPQRDIRINGVLWPIDEPFQIAQLPSPDGLGTDIMTPAVHLNPFSKGTQWTYLGDGRWQYIGDGSVNGLRFFSDVVHPVNGFIEFEVESYSGTGAMRCSGGFMPTNQVGSSFSGVGVKRSFYKGYQTPANIFQFQRNGASDIVSCVIKNIKFKPLGTCNPMSLTGVSNLNWSEIDL